MSYFLDDTSDHPDAIELEICGVRFPWLLNKTAFDRAIEEGIDFASFADLDEEDVPGNLDALVSVLYAGTLPFDDEDVTREDFEEVVTPRIAQKVAPKVMGHFHGLDDEELPEEVVSGK